MWRNIQGYAGTYRINIMGEVQRKTGDTYRTVKAVKSSNGRLCITLWKNGKRKCYMLHNLVAETFDIPVSDVNKIIYEGYSGNSEAVEELKCWIKEKISDCESAIIHEENRTEKYSDEILYLKKFMKYMEPEIVERKMKKKFKTVRSTKQLKTMLYEVIKSTGEPLFLFENQAVEMFLSLDDDIEDRFKYRKYQYEKIHKEEKSYQKRDAVIPVYLTEEMWNKVDAYAKSREVSRTAVVLQALEDYCGFRIAIE